MQVAGLVTDLIAVKQCQRLAGAFLAVVALGVPSLASAQRDPVLPVPLQPVVDEYFRSCTQKTLSGLGYNLLRLGKGRTAGLADIVTIDYIVYSAYSGEVFDQNTEAALPMDGMIAGVAEGLQLVAEGSVIRLCIPAKQAYGTKGVGPIPPDTDLVFQAELRSVLTRKEFEAKARRTPRPKD